MLATTAAIVGYLGVAVGMERVVDLGNEIAASDGSPSPEQQTRVDHLTSALQTHGKIDLTLLLLAVTAMATARYW